MMLVRVRLLLLLSSLLLATTKTTYASTHAESQIAWIRSKGGFFSRKIEFQLLDKNDENSAMGVFALEELHKGETLMVVPKECLIFSEGGSEDPCDTARNIVKHRKLGNASEYAPWINYVFEPKYKHDLPSAWSPAGKHLIETIIGSEMPPFGVTNIDFKKVCGEGSGDAELDQDAWLIVVRRSWDDVMVPILDMVNHRNGKWYNVDSNSAHEGKDITVFASRDVEQGEQLYLSYNECTDCHDIEWTYVLTDIFRDYGFIEQYPRRWNIEDLVFEIDEDEETKELKLTFLDGEPNAYQRKFMRGQLKRLRGMKDYVATKVAKLDSAHERFMTVEYYNAAMTALGLALREAEASKDQECSAPASGEETCPFREYDALETVPETVRFNYAICDFQRIHRRKSYHEIDTAQSLYQEMLFKYSPKLDDTCLYMNDHLHACASFRPHYHEVFVHYPAMFVDEVKRVAFIGGGDNMIVHEILKYPSLELVVGMELDQQVVRSSFKNFGTQPHFDDERLQWFFGDGSKSLLMLPEEYYGTFDVVYVDLQNDVVDILKVADEFSITDAAMLLLKPDGVIARNEDWEFHTSEPFADYSVDILYVDLPAIGYQGITLGSNTVDFLTQAPKDHGVETIYMPSVDKMADRFKIWYNYRKSSNRTSTICKEPEAQDREILTDELRSGLGILMIIEAEEAAAPLEDASAVQEKISAALKNTQLAEVAAQVLPDDVGYEMLFILKEGYVMARVWTELEYCAFDVLLWSSTNKMDAIKAQLVAAVDSKSVSSYRILTSGMFGVSSTDKDDKTSLVGPRIKEPCKQEPVKKKDDNVQVEQNVIDSVLSESIKLFPDPNALVVVLCGEQSSPCNSVGVLQNMNDEVIAKVVPLWACPNLNDASPEVMLACEESMSQTLQNLDTIDGLVIDVEAPRAMGQILLKILTSNYSVQGSSLLSENHVVISTFAVSGQESTRPWRRALVDRFRTDIVKYDPAYRAQVLVSDDDKLELDIFSSGDEHFYMHLVEMLKSIPTTTQVQLVQNGINNYIADFEPSMRFTHADYDDAAAMKQWESQEPFEVQTIHQFVLPDKKTSVETLQDTLAQALIKWNGHEEEDTLVYDKIILQSDGCVLFSHWPMGSMVVVWDGRSHVSVNLFSSQDSIPQLQSHLTNNKWKLIARDEMPRGTGKVVNFKDEDLHVVPHWAQERPPDV